MISDTCNIHKMAKGKSKANCWKCNMKHGPPTGKKCKETINSAQLSVNASTSEGSSDSDSFVASPSVKQGGSVKAQKSKVKQKDCYVQKPSGSSDLPAGMDDGAGASSGDVQLKILHELQHVNSRLDTVEDQVSKRKRKCKDRPKDCHKISNTCSGVTKNCKLKRVVQNLHQKMKIFQVCHLLDLQGKCRNVWMIELPKLRKFLSHKVMIIQRLSRNRGGGRGRKSWCLRKLHGPKTRF